MSEGFNEQLQEWLQGDEPEAVLAREHLSDFLSLVNHQHSYHYCDAMEEAYKEDGEEFKIEDHEEDGYTVSLAGLVFYEDTHGYGMFTEHWQTYMGDSREEYFGSVGRIHENVTVLDTYGDAIRGLEGCYEKEQAEHRKFNRERRNQQDEERNERV